MQNSLWKELEIFSNTMVPLVLAFAACIARVAREGWQGFCLFIQNFIVGAFVGVIVYWGLDYWDFSPKVQAAITGGCIYPSKYILDALQEKIVTFIRDWHVKRNER